MTFNCIFPRLASLSFLTFILSLTPLLARAEGHILSITLFWESHKGTNDGKRSGRYDL